MITTKINQEILDFINRALDKVVYTITLPVAIRLIMNILEEFYPDKSSDELYELLIFKANPRLSFPKSDIDNITFVHHDDDKISVEMTLNFLSIFGATSPLPIHYNEKVLEDSHHDRVLVDFLDMLNHRLKKLIYPIWVKQRYYVQYQDNLQDNFSKYILSMLGLHGQSAEIPTHLNLHKLLPFSGILSMHQKSSVSLEAILKHYFSHDAIYIKEGIISKSNIPQIQYATLGSENCTLGEDMSIGTFLLTQNLKYQIRFEKISWEDIEAFSHNGAKQKEIKVLMDLIQKIPLSYEVSIMIDTEEIRPFLLGSSGSLGVNSWLGEIGSTQEVIFATS